MEKDTLGTEGFDRKRSARSDVKEDEGRTPEGGGDLSEVWVGVCRRGLQTLTLSETRDLHILLVFCVFCLP